jgi:hypothetical protein
MELIAAVLIAGPLGYYVQSSKRALIAYLGVWAVIFPIQTFIVGADDPLYWIFNALILAGGIGLNRLGARRAEQRQSPAVAVTSSSS